MKVNIYYGGRGLMDDPTLFVISKMQEVLEELHVTVETFYLYDQKNNIPTLPQTLKNADGIILATTVEWFGIGGYMQQFLDACWLYGDKEKISKIYMCPIVMATTYGEREGKLNLSNAWEILGGMPCSGICGYITDYLMMENNPSYIKIIEKKAENLYRTIKQKLPSLPASNQAVKQKISITKNTDLTPQESEQLSQYAADENYVQRQKADIRELTGIYRDKMNLEEPSETSEYVEEFKTHFKPQPGLKARYRISIERMPKPLMLEVDGPDLSCYYGGAEQADVEMSLKKDTLNEIVAGRMTFQRAFMSGEMKMKGDFRILRNLDTVFLFMQA